jgi:UDP-hydrolysing UDP-N-acetyl-D-glucosamine 2-epimerase
VERAGAEDGWGIAARVAMQREGETGRAADAAALGRGVSGFARVFGEMFGGRGAEFVVVLGDRIEAFAAASAAAIGGVGVAHIHAGDRASGVADEGMRHAISKLAHVHFAATEASAARLVRMGIEPWRIVLSGSPAAEGIASVRATLPVGLDEWTRVFVLAHPCGLGERGDAAWMRAIVGGVRAALGPGEAAAWGEPNADPGREGVVGVLRESGFARVGHLEHGVFRGVLRWLGERGGVLIGNSSAGLIEAPLLGCASVDVGPRQDGRERGETVRSVRVRDADAVAQAVAEARAEAVAGGSAGGERRYGDGGAARRIAGTLASIDPAAGGFLRTRNAY